MFFRRNNVNIITTFVQLTVEEVSIVIYTRFIANVKKSKNRSQRLKNPHMVKVKLG